MYWTSSILVEIELKIMHKKVTDWRKRSKTLNKIKPVENINKNSQSFLKIRPVQKEVLLSHKLQDQAYQ